jgi:hypothetical protein
MLSLYNLKSIGNLFLLLKLFLNISEYFIRNLFFLKRRNKGVMK